MRDYFMRMLLPERPNGTILKYSRLQGNVDSSHQAVIFELSEITSFEVLQDLKKRLDTNLNDTNLNNSIDPTIIHIKHGTKDDGSYFCGLVVNETRLYREKNRSLLIVASQGKLNLGLQQSRLNSFGNVFGSIDDAVSSYLQK